jgi:DNA-directed RNA polymerase specialized sigma24 family protein
MEKVRGETSDHEPQQWAILLRARFLAVARRRLPADMSEDAVQEALRIIVEKGITLGRGDVIEGQPALAWCFQVLRHTIGNTYRRQRTRGAREAAAGDPLSLDVASTAPTPLESLQRNEAGRAIRDSLEELAAGDRACGRYLGRMLEGAGLADLAVEEGTTAPILSRRIYRCRQKLRALLRARGVDA